MLTCGVNKPGERMSKLKIRVEDCVDEGEVGEVEVEVGSEEEVLEKEEVLTTGLGGEVDEEVDEGEDEEGAEEGIGIEMETICDICHLFNVTFS